MNKLRKGQQHEQLAQQLSSQQGYQILAQNFFCKGGELDLVALDHQTLVFIEVKYRANAYHGHPSEFVNTTKQQRLQHCAQVFLQHHPQYQQYEMRFDVLSFLADNPTPQWLKNAFGGW